MTQKTTIVITMAGFGRRFLDAGYTVPKYMIQARGLTLFDWSMKGLQSFIDTGSPFVFVVRAEDRAADFIRERAAARGIGTVGVIELAAPTDGQATTARLACGEIDGAAPMAIFNIDTGVQPGLLQPGQAAGYGWIPCFRAPGEGWSFVRCADDGRAVEVREKNRISELATIGFYWFSSAALYARAYDAYYAVAGREERGERYVAPLYNQLIAEAREVTVTEIPFGSVTPLGTPDEVSRFLAD
ncbi:glycosyltransferase family 2 protein [Geomonas sp. Red69]|uniref:Glycosyltransferase family 2 protein n=1 Tax=Geomonas diazotrophica TaxID=2843197 RepID=A0ABX8JLP5_9BACT|nr:MULTISPECIES: glycosyltransferase family 2 protein [Geomonas]MBU5637829.1 glycosyltransferase family 2 protein [Geomonas diazotrophica]QWV96360.1 glycosyltransferase family 2 protein [Geomonas nitrogeniifigens]